jgi:hypothetical protein
MSRDYIIQANSVQNVGIYLSSELRALRGVASIVTTGGVHNTLDVHPAVYKIKNIFKIKLTNITNRNIYIRQGTDWLQVRYSRQAALTRLAPP